MQAGLCQVSAATQWGQSREQVGETTREPKLARGAGRMG